MDSDNLSEEIKNIILSYCQGRLHLEFDMDVLPDMVSKIADIKGSSKKEITHNQPMHGFYYWVKFNHDTEYEIAYCYRYKDDKMEFQPTSGEAAYVNDIIDWKRQPPIFNEMTDCDYRKQECTNDGETIDGKWVCSKHKRTASAGFDDGYEIGYQDALRDYGHTAESMQKSDETSTINQESDSERLLGDFLQWFLEQQGLDEMGYDVKDNVSEYLSIHT